MGDKINKVSNPLTIIAIFAAITEVMGTIVISINKNPEVIYLIYFLIGFPTLLVILFFLTLNYNSKVLYSPSDFTDENNYLKALRVTDSYDILNNELEKLEEKLSSSLSTQSNLKIEEVKKSLSETIETIKQTKTENKRILFDHYLPKTERSEVENIVFNYLNMKSQPETLDSISHNLNIATHSVKAVIESMVSQGIIKQTVKNTHKAYTT